MLTNDATKSKDSRKAIAEFCVISPLSLFDCLGRYDTLIYMSSLKLIPHRTSNYYDGSLFFIEFLCEPA